MAAVIDATKSDYMTSTSDVKAGIRLKDFVHWKLGFSLSLVFEMMTLDYKILAFLISYSGSGKNR